MPQEIESQVQVAEERLRRAMLASDVETLDELTSPELLFTNHFGQVLGKEEDLTLHQSGILKFYALEACESRVKIGDTTAVISVRMRMFRRL